MDRRRLENVCISYQCSFASFVGSGAATPVSRVYVMQLEATFVIWVYPLSYGVPVRERYGSTLLPATREQHDQNCTQSH